MKNLCHWSLGAALVLVLAVAACGRTEKTPKPATGMANTAEPVGATAANPASGMPVAGSDRVFVAEAATSGLAEVEASRFITEKTADTALRTYTQQMEREHMSTNDELKRIAGGKGLAAQTTVEGDLKTRLDKLKSLPLTLVDQAFLEDFGIDAHNKAIRLFEEQARQGQDPELRAFAEQTLPKLREHLTMAQQLQNRKAGT